MGLWPTFVLPSLIGSQDRAPLDWSRLSVRGPWGHHILAYEPYANLDFPPVSLHSRGCFQSARASKFRREDLVEQMAAERAVAAGLPDPHPAPLGDAPPRTNDWWLGRPAEAEWQGVVYPEGEEIEAFPEGSRRVVRHGDVVMEDKNGWPMPSGESYERWRLLPADEVELFEPAGPLGPFAVDDRDGWGPKHPNNIARAARWKADQDKIDQAMAAMRAEAEAAAEAIRIEAEAAAESVRAAEAREADDPGDAGTIEFAVGEDPVAAEDVAEDQVAEDQVGDAVSPLVAPVDPDDDGDAASPEASGEAEPVTSAPFGGATDGGADESVADDAGQDHAGGVATSVASSAGGDEGPASLEGLGGTEAATPPLVPLPTDGGVVVPVLIPPALDEAVTDEGAGSDLGPAAVPHDSARAEVVGPETDDLVVILKS